MSQPPTRGTPSSRNSGTNTTSRPSSNGPPAGAAAAAAAVASSSAPSSNPSSPPAPKPPTLAASEAAAAAALQQQPPPPPPAQEKSAENSASSSSGQIPPPPAPPPPSSGTAATAPASTAAAATAPVPSQQAAAAAATSGSAAAAAAATSAASPSSASGTGAGAAPPSRCRPAIQLTQNLIQTYHDTNERIFYKKRQEASGTKHNDGYDDSHGHYLVFPGEEIIGRYAVLETLGRGSFGTVVRAYDTRRKEMVAAKITRSGRGFRDQAKLEIDILMKILTQASDSKTVRILKAFDWKGHLVIVFELLSFNLYQLLQCTNYHGVSLDLTSKFAFQLLMVLRDMERLTPPVIHCLAKDMELLTAEGWLGYEAVKARVASSCSSSSSEEFLVAGFDTETRRLVYERPAAFIDKPGAPSDGMYEISTTSDHAGFSIRVSGQHQLLLQEEKSAAFKKMTVKDLLKMPGGTKLRLVDHAAGGVEQQRLRATETAEAAEMMISPDDEEEKCSKVEKSVTQAAQLSCSSNVDRDDGEPLPEWVFQLPMEMGKEFLFKNFAASNSSKIDDSNKIFSIVSTSQQRRDDLQRLALHLGYSTTASSSLVDASWNVTFRSEAAAAATEKQGEEGALFTVADIKKVDGYTDGVWCVHMPRGNIVVRRRNATNTTTTTSSSSSSSTATMRPIIMGNCDLKPENVLLVNQNRSAIRVIDFGSACYLNRRLFRYIQSRYYRSPEVILNLEYGLAIDRWSLGCILVELHTGVALFDGRNEAQQLQRFEGLLGPLPHHMVAASPKRDNFYESVTDPSTGQVTYQLKLPPEPQHQRTLQQVLERVQRRRHHSSSASSSSTQPQQQLPAGENSQSSAGGDSQERYEQFIDLVKKLLEYDPAKRIGVLPSMEHPFLCEFMPYYQQRTANAQQHQQQQLSAQQQQAQQQQGGAQSSSSATNSGSNSTSNPPQAAGAAAASPGGTGSGASSNQQQQPSASTAALPHVTGPGAPATDRAAAPTSDQAAAGS